MKLLAVHLSGKASETKTFQEKLEMLSQIREEQPPKVSMNQFSVLMVCLWKFKEHRSLYSRCKNSAAIHAWYIHNQNTLLSLAI